MKRISQNKYENILDMLSKMDIQINKLTDLIIEMLDVSKIQSGKLILDYKKINLDKLISDEINNIRLIVNLDPENNQKYNFVFNSRSGAYIYGDKFRISQVINNLLSNAVKFSNKSKKIVLRTIVYSDKVVVSVRDFGVGIPLQKQKYLFSRFYQIESQNVKNNAFTSLGLGLYISYNIIRQHQGKIWVKSDLGKGSTFYFSLPLKKAL